MSSLIRLLLPVLFMLAATGAISQTYNFHNFNIDDGLAHSRVNVMMQDRKGYIWIGTDGGGLSRFDGKFFQNFNKENGLASNQVNTLFEDSTGILWIGTGEGLCSYDGIEFKTYLTKVEDESNFHLNIVQSDEGSLFIGNSKGVLRFDGSRFIGFSQEQDLKDIYISTSFRDSKGTIWFGTAGHGVFRLNKSGMTKLGEGEGLLDQFANTITEDQLGNILVGTDKGIYVNVADSFAPWNPASAFGSRIIRKIFCSSQNDYWIGTSEGLFRISRNKVNEFKVNNGLTNDDINSITEDREGLIWIGTASGFSRFDNERFITYTTKDGLQGDIIMSSYRDKKNRLWFGSWNNGLSYFADGKITIIPSAELPTSRRIMSITGQGDNVLFAVYGAGIYVFDGSRFRKMEQVQNLALHTAEHLFTDLQGRVWISTNGGGLILYENGIYTKYGVENGLISDYISSVTEDKKGNIWVCLSGGISMYNGESFKNYSTRQGIPGRAVIQAVEDKNGLLWIATEKGLCVFDGTTFTSFNKKSGLINDQVLSLGVDDRYLLAGTNSGLMAISLEDYFRKKKLTIRSFAKEEGFLGVECNTRAIYKDRDGRFWIGTIKGVTRFSPEMDIINRVQPVTHISSVRLFFENVNWKEYTDSIDPNTSLPLNLQLNYDNNHITFEFTGISTRVPEKVKFRFMLVGFDKEWSPATSRKEAVYSNLPPGHYTFRVIACNNEGYWNTEPTEFSFDVGAPFWRTWWFYVLAATFVFLCVYGVIKYRERSLINQQRALEEKVVKRTLQLNEEKLIVEQQNALINKKNKDITDSINYAKRIQESILPPFEKITKVFPDSFVIFKPRDIVSGDFYWFNVNGSKAIIGAIDCTGHGVPGAFMSMIGNTLLNEIVNERDIIRPDLILTQLNLGIKKVLTQNEIEFQYRDGMDVSICCIDVNDNSLEFSGANQNLYIVSDGDIKTIKGDIYSIGGIEPGESLFTNNKIQLNKGDAIYLQTDGFEDQFGDKEKKKFLSQRYKNTLAEISTLEMSRQRILLEQAFNDWKGQYRQIDDILVIGIRV